MRPTQSKLKTTLFNIISEDIVDSSFLDLFAGVGGIGCEALSREAAHVTFVEKDPKALSAIKKNVALLEEEECVTILPFDVLLALKKLAKTNTSFDIIFADPPYGTAKDSFSNLVLKMVDESDLLKKQGSLFLEDAIAASQEDIPLKQLHLKSSRRIGGTILRHYIK